jgi:hypothetical protein
VKNENQKTKQTKSPNQTKTKYPKFKCNTVSVRPSAFSSSSVVASSKEEREKKRKRVWRQFCECLSEALAHLLATVSRMLLEALLISSLRNELITHIVPQALFI